MNTFKQFLLEEVTKKVTNRQKVMNALTAVGLKPDIASPDRLRIFTDGLVDSVKNKFYGLGEKIPRNKRSEFEKALQKEFGSDANVSVSFHVEVRVPRIKIKEGLFDGMTGGEKNNPLKLMKNLTVKKDGDEFFIPLSDDRYWYLHTDGKPYFGTDGNGNKSSGFFASKAKANAALAKFRNK